MTRNLSQLCLVGILALLTSESGFAYPKLTSTQIATESSFLKSLTTSREKALGDKGTEEDTTLLNPYKGVRFEAARLAYQAHLGEAQKLIEKQIALNAQISERNMELSEIRQRLKNSAVYSAPDSDYLPEDDRSRKYELQSELTRLQYGLTHLQDYDLKEKHKQLALLKPILEHFNDELKNKCLMEHYRFNKQLNRAISSMSKNADYEKVLKEIIATVQGHSEHHRKCFLPKLRSFLGIRSFTEKKDLDQTTPLIRVARVPLIEYRSAPGAVKKTSSHKQNQLIKLLATQPTARLNDQDSAGDTALIHLVRNGNLRSVRTLVKLGAKIQIENKLGVTALELILEELINLDKHTHGIPNSLKNKIEIAELLVKQSSKSELKKIQTKLFKKNAEKYSMSMSSSKEGQLDPFSQLGCDSESRFHNLITLIRAKGISAPREKLDSSVSENNEA